MIYTDPQWLNFSTDMCIGHFESLLPVFNFANFHKNPNQTNTALWVCPLVIFENLAIVTMTENDLHWLTMTKFTIILSHCCQFSQKIQIKQYRTVSMTQSKLIFMRCFMSLFRHNIINFEITIFEYLYSFDFYPIQEYMAIQVFVYLNIFMTTIIIISNLGITIKSFSDTKSLLPPFFIISCW